MTIYFTSDLHLGHKNIIQYCNRPFSSVDEMNRTIIDNINDTVGEDDLLILLGDLCMGKIKDTLPLLGEIKCGDTIMIPGNHDRNFQQSADWHSAYANYMDEILYVHEFQSRAATICLDHDTIFHMSHFPYEGDSQDSDRYADQRPIDNGNWLLHGHVHDTFKVSGRQINVGVDVWDFRPVSETQILEIVNARA